jgi:hypothetical protein
MLCSTPIDKYLVLSRTRNLHLVRDLQWEVGPHMEVDDSAFVMVTFAKGSFEDQSLAYWLLSFPQINEGTILW